MRFPVLLIASFVEAMNIFITYPVMPRLLGEIGHLNLSDAAVVAGWMLTSYALAQLLLAPLCGRLSDAHGRRLILLIAFLAYAVDYACMSLANTVPWLFLGRTISGGIGATSVIVNAYLADITESGELAGRYGLMGSSYGCGFILGPALGGLLAPLGTRAPFVAASGMAACAAFLCFWALPESLPPEKRKPFRISECDVFSATFAALRRTQLRPLLIAIFLFELSLSVYPSLWSFYLMQRMHWQAPLIGFALAFTGLMVMLGQGLLLGRIVKRFGQRITALLGTIATIFAFLGYTVAHSTAAIFGLSTLDLASFMVIPSLTALISERSSGDEHGHVQGIVASINGLTLILGPVLCSRLFAWSTKNLAEPFAAGLPFFAAAICCGFALLTITRTEIRDPLEN